MKVTQMMIGISRSIRIAEYLNMKYNALSYGIYYFLTETFIFSIFSSKIVIRKSGGIVSEICRRSGLDYAGQVIAPVCLP